MGKRTVWMALASAMVIMFSSLGNVIPNTTIVAHAADQLQNGVRVSWNMAADETEIKYTLKIAEVSLVDLECTSKYSGLTFGLFDSSSQLINEKSSDYYAMSHVAQVLIPGEYTLRVQRKSVVNKAEIGYSILPTFKPLRGNEKTPDSFANPVVLKMKERVYGTIAFNDETDVYKFSVDKKSTVSAHLTCQMYSISDDMSSTSKEASFNYSIKDSNLVVVQSGSVKGQIDSPSTTVVTDEYEPGDYYIFVTRASENSTGEYSVMWIQDAFSTTGLKMTGSKSVVVGKTSQFKVSALPASSDDSKATWTSSDQSVLRINSNSVHSGVRSCKFTALECGEAVITATLDSNKLVTVKKKVKVVPATPKVKSLKNTESSMAKLTWKKTKTADGYQIQYAPDNSEFKINVKSTKVKDKNNATLKKLKKNKTYYVRIRSYKKGADGKKYYSDWSKVQKIKIKK